MAFIDPYVDDKRWDTLQADPLKLVKARDKLFGAYLQADPARKTYYLAQPEAEQKKLYEGFVERITRARPEKFQIEVEGGYTEEVELPANRLGGPERIKRQVPARTRLVGDEATEETLAKIKSGEVDPYKLPVEAFQELGPLVDWGAPELSDHWRAAAKEQVGNYSGARVAGRNVLEGANPIRKQQASFSAGVGGPGIPNQPGEESERAAQVQSVEDWISGGAEGFRAAGAVLGSAGLGIAGYQGLAKAGVKLLTPKGIALQALAVDAPIGAAYAEDAPGLLSASLAELTGDPDLERNAIINGLEAAGIGALAGLGLRQLTIGRLKDYARGLGWAGKSNADLRRWVNEQRFRRSKGVHTEPVGRQVGGEPPPAAAAPVSDRPTPPRGPSDIERRLIGQSDRVPEAPATTTAPDLVDPDAGLREIVAPDETFDVVQMGQKPTAPAKPVEAPAAEAKPTKARKGKKAQPLDEGAGQDADFEIIEEGEQIVGVRGAQRIVATKQGKSGRLWSFKDEHGASYKGTRDETISNLKMVTRAKKHADIWEATKAKELEQFPEELRPFITIWKEGQYHIPDAERGAGTYMVESAQEAQEIALRQRQVVIERSKQIPEEARDRIGINALGTFTLKLPEGRQHFRQSTPTFRSLADALRLYQRTAPGHMAPAPEEVIQLRRPKGLKVSPHYNQIKVQKVAPDAWVHTVHTGGTDWSSSGPLDPSDVGFPTKEAAILHAYNEAIERVEQQVKRRDAKPADKQVLKAWINARDGFKKTVSPPQLSGSQTSRADPVTESVTAQKKTTPAIGDGKDKIIKKGARPPLPARADGEADILTFIDEQGGIKSPAHIQNRPGGEWDAFREAFSGVARMVVTKHGQTIDQILQDFAARGMGEMSADDLYAKVASAVKDRERVKKQWAQMEARGIFEQAAFENDRPKNNPADPQAVATDSLVVGDQFKVKRQPFEVVDVTPEGEVMAKDGERFGTQSLPPGAALHPDKGSFKPADPGAATKGPSADPFGLDEIEREPIVNVDPRSGQSEMLPGDDATFSLHGSQMEDPSKQFQRSVDAREGEKDQLGMFDPNDVRSYEADDGGSIFEPAAQYGNDDLALAYELSAQKLNGPIMERLAALVATKPVSPQIKQHFKNLLDFHYVNDAIRQLKNQTEPQIEAAMQTARRANPRAPGEDLLTHLERLRQLPEVRQVRDPFEQKKAQLEGLADDVATRIRDRDEGGVSTSLYGLTKTIESASVWPGLNSPDLKQLANELAVAYQQAAAELLREPAARYADRLEITDPKYRDGAIDYATRVLQSKKDAPGQAYFSLDQTPAVAPASGLSSTAGPPDVGRFFRDPFHPDEQIRAALAQGQRLSSILPEHVTGGVPVFSVEGKILASTEDFALTQLALRSPFQESVKVAITDARGKVWHSEVQTLGTLTSSLVDPQLTANAVSRARQKGLKGKARVWMSHNHPSGVVDPSSADIAVQRQMAQWAEMAEVDLADFIVTDGDDFYSFAQGSTIPFNTPHTAPWELTRRVSRGKIDRPDQLQVMVAGLRQGNPDAEFIIFVDRKNRINAVQQVPGTVLHSQWVREIVTGAGESGASGVFLITNQDRAFIAVVRDKLKASRVELIDATGKGETSYREAGVLEAPARYEGEAPGTVREGPPADETTPKPPEDEEPLDWNAPLAYIHPGQPPVKVQLGGLEVVKAIEMPELVHLARMFMAGAFPELKRLPKYAGYFKPDGFAPGGGRIVLDKRIFRDQRGAARTLAHEIGHFLDFLPDKSMDRGNILGRLSSLLNYLAHTIEELPIGNPRDPDRLTPDDRKELNKQAISKTVAELGGKPKEAGEARDHWNATRRDHYHLLVGKEIENRELLTQAEVRAELLELTKWWHPYDPASVPDSYKKYRESSRELYAEMMSVLFNNPAELRERAPIAWRVFFNYLENKGPVKADLVALWDFLAKPHVNTLKKRQTDVRKMFARGEEILMRKADERAARYRSFRGWKDRVRLELDDVFSPLTGRQAKLEKRGIPIPESLNMRHLFGEHPLAENTAYRFLQGVYERVVKPLEAEELTLQDLGEIMMAERVLNERFDVSNRATGGGRAQMANPLGHTPDTARMARTYWILTNGLDKFQALQHHINRFRAQVDRLIENAVEEGVYSKQIYDEVIAPNKEHYATFAVLDYLQEYVPAGVKMQEGTLKEIANPFTAEVLKMLSLSRWIQVNRAKAGARDFLKNFFPAEIKPAETRFDKNTNTLKPIDNPDVDGGQIDVFEDGRLVRYWVADKLIEKAFEGVAPASASAIGEVVYRGFRSLVYPFIIRYNPAFQLYMGPMRDLRRTLVNMPKHTGIKVAGQFLRNWGTLFRIIPPNTLQKEIRAYLRGESSALFNEMMENWAVGTPYDNFRRDLGRQDSFEEIMRRFQLLPEKKRAAWLNTEIMQKVIKLGEAIEFAGLTFEMLPKAAAYKYLTRDLGWTRKDAAEFVRNHTGVPNFRERGHLTAAVSNTIFPFFQVFLKGYQHDARLMFNAKTAGGWWFRYMATNGMWRILQALGAAGLLGASIKEYYDRVSDYTKTNYTTVPVGQVPGGDFGWKTVALTIPEDETQRMVGGIIHHVIQSMAGAEGARPSNVLAFGAGQLPGLNPVVDVPAKWAAYLSGLNPYDDFTGRGILTNDQYLTGGWEAHREMFLWTLTQTGVSNFFKWNPRWDTATEMRIGALPVINRIVRVSDYGKREQQEIQQREMDRVRAALRLKMPETVRRLYGERNALTGIRKELRTPEQMDRLIDLNDWYRAVYKPTEEELLSAADRYRKGGSSKVDAWTLRALEMSSEPYLKRRD